MAPCDGYFCIFSRFTSSGVTGRPIKKHDLHCRYVGAYRETLPSISGARPTPLYIQTLRATPNLANRPPR